METEANSVTLFSSENPLQFSSDQLLSRVQLHLQSIYFPVLIIRHPTINKKSIELTGNSVV